MLQAPEFANLVEKVNHNCIPVDYFRKNLFVATIKDSYDLKRKKTIFDDGKTVIKVDRSLNQRHRDLLSILMYEEKSDVESNGRFYIRTKLYQLAKKLGYKSPGKATNRVYEMVIDMSKTMIYVNQNNRVYNHSLIGDGYYNKEDDTYIIEIPPATAKYLIYNVGVSIPEEINQKIINIKNAQLKALVSFMLSNKRLENGIGFDTICEKIEIRNTDKSRAKSKFKKIVKENAELLAEFGIFLKDKKFYLEKQKVEFYHALSNKELKNYELKQQKSKVDNTELQDVIGREVVIENNKYVLHGVELETDTKKENYNCYNVLLKSANQIAMMRTMYTTEEGVVEYIRKYLLGVEQWE